MCEKARPTQETQNHCPANRQPHDHHRRRTTHPNHNRPPRHLRPPSQGNRRTPGQRNPQASERTQMNIHATASFHGKWWVLEFETPAGVRFTQARHLKDAEEMIRDICTMEHVNVENVAIKPQVPAIVREYHEKSTRVTQEQEALARTSKKTVATLRDLGMSVRDVASVMGISPGRVSQLAK